METNKIKAVLFDLDDTLYDYDYANEFAMKAVFEEIKSRGINDDYEDAIKKFNEAKDEVKRTLVGTAASHNRILYFQKYMEKEAGTVEPKLIIKLYRTYWDTLLENAKLYDGVEETLEWLQGRKINIVIVTNLTTFIQLRKLETLGLEDYVDYIITSEEAGVEKPHPAIFLMALNKVDCKPEEAIFIGDSLSADVEGANTLDMQTIHIVENLGKRDDIPKGTDENPDYRAITFKEIKGIIEGIL